MLFYEVRRTSSEYIIIRVKHEAGGDHEEKGSEPSEGERNTYFP